MTSKERVRRAIEFDNPDRLPVFATENTDIARLSYVDPTGWLPRFRPIGEFTDEWGSVWYTCDDTMGHVARPAIADIKKAHKFVFPNPHLPDRWRNFNAQIIEQKDRYIIGNAQYLCFDRLTFLLGEIAALEALLIHEHEVLQLIERIVEFELSIVDELADRGVDGIRFWDDVGAGNGVIMGPATWRKMLAPHYRRVFEHVQNRGLHVHYHSCGDCMDIMQALYEAGVDVFSIGEPFMMGIDRLVEKFAGRVCFECSPDNRSILSGENKNDIENAVEELVSGFSSGAGGLILVAAPSNFDCVSPLAQQMAIQAVRQILSTAKRA